MCSKMNGVLRLQLGVIAVGYSTLLVGITIFPWHLKIIDTYRTECFRNSALKNDILLAKRRGQR